MSFRDLLRDRRRARASRAGRRRAAELEVLPSCFRLSVRAEAWISQIEDELRWLEKRIRNGTDRLGRPGCESCGPGTSHPVAGDPRGGELRGGELCAAVSDASFESLVFTGLPEYSPSGRPTDRVLTSLGHCLRGCTSPQ